MKTFDFLPLLAATAAVAMLSEHSLWAESPFGQVIGWGRNLTGAATGVSSGYSFSTGAVQVADSFVNDAVAISAGASHSLSVRADGTVSGWGANFFGETTGFQTEHPFRTNGQVRIAGQTLSNIVSISAGCGFSLAAKSDGTVVAWGQGTEKERSHVTVPPDLSNVVAVAAGCSYSLALKRDGTVVGWGMRRAPEGLSNIVAIAAGREDHAASLALRRDGVVFEWRSENQAATVAATNAIAIAAGPHHGLALRRDGTVFGWGGNGNGEATGIAKTDAPYIGSGLVSLGGQVVSNVVAVAAGKGFSLGLQRDGTIVAWGRVNNGLQPVTVPAGLRDVVAISAGDDFSLAITTNSSVVTKLGQ